jgi:hypothetical protein
MRAENLASKGFAENLRQNLIDKNGICLYPQKLHTHEQITYIDSIIV